jgi:hypothetical protein
MNEQHIEEQLWNYIDGNCNETERAEITARIHSDSVWKTQYNELLQVHEMIHASTLEEPSLRFTLNVMEEIAQSHITPAARTYINKKVIYGIGGFFLTLIAGLLVYTFAQINWTESSGVTLPFETGQANWMKLFNSTYVKIFMMINIVLALMMLDKYLHRRKNGVAGKKFD